MLDNFQKSMLNQQNFWTGAKSQFQTSRKVMNLFTQYLG